MMSSGSITPSISGGSSGNSPVIELQPVPATTRAARISSR